MISKTIFIELDSLFDTRLGVLYMEFGEKILDILPTYKKRNIDSFMPLVNNADFAELYRKRNKDVLRNSMQTNIFGLAKSFVNNAISEMTLNPFPASPRVILNTYPYNLTFDEKQIFLKLLIAKVSSYADIDIVYLPNKDINPKYLNENVELLIKYDYTEWFEDQALHNTYVKHKCPDVKFITPAILNMDSKALSEVIENEKESPMGTFDSFRFVFADLIDLEFSKPSLFCYAD